MKDETVPNGIGIPFTTISKKYTNSELRLGVGAVTVLAVSIGMSKDELADVIREQYRDAETTSTSPWRSMMPQLHSFLENSH